MSSRVAARSPTCQPGAGSSGSVVPLLAKFNPDGSPDTSFGLDGVLGVSGGGGRGIRFDEIAMWVTPSPGGKIVFGGSLDEVLDENLSGRSGFGVARLNPDGSLDSSFSGDGVLRDNPDWSSVDEVPGGIHFYDDAVVLPDGRVLTAFSIGVARITAAGAIDTTFGGGDGFATAPPASGAFLTSLIVDAAGRILVGRTVSPHSVAIARFTPNGNVDTTFGGGDGLVTRRIPGDAQFARLFRLSPGENNTFYAYTSLGDGDVSRFEVLRFQNDAGGPPPTGPTIGIVNDILIADGRWGADRITIERKGKDNVIVRVNDLTREFDMDDFDSVLLRGNAGYDDIRVLDSIIDETRVRMVTIEGGNGNDTLQGSSGADVIRGGAGNDRMFGGAGADALDGGDNDDFIDSSDSATNDTVLGGNGTDTALIDAGDNASGVERFE